MTNDGGTMLTSPMPGIIVKVHRSNGNEISVGEPILTLESMKMEVPVVSTVNGVIENLNTKEGDVLNKNDIICQIC